MPEWTGQGPARPVWDDQAWFTEEQAEDLRFSIQARAWLYSGRSEFQRLDLVETERYGRLLALDGLVQTTERDEFCYHEMIVHPALSMHPDPRRVLVIGGGDGGTVREVLRHSRVREVTMVEIDREVVDLSRRYLPTLSAALEDSRLDLHIGDGVAFAKDAEDGSFDIVLVDSSEPIGVGVRLFSGAFYREVSRILRPDGILVAQSESPFVNADLIRRIQRALRRTFHHVHLYHAYVPTYPSGCWTFSIASNGLDPATAPPLYPPPGETRYYTPDVHRGAFALPPFIAALCAEGEEEDAKAPGGGAGG